MPLANDTLQHILIVEDDENTAEMLSAYFSSLEYSVTHTPWGQDAVRIATEILPDLVVLDIHLPDIDGYEVCRRLRNQRRTGHTPIIFLTERRERLDRLTGLELGAVDYITKPFDVQELRYRVRNILRRSNLDSLLHPISSLPTSDLLEEQLERVRNSPTLTMILVSVLGIKGFSDAYGFVTRDDVLRAVALILKNTAAESIDSDPFVGQIDDFRYLIVAPVDGSGNAIVKQLNKRLYEAIPFFYPYQDWENGTCNDGSPLPLIKFRITQLPDSLINQANSLPLLRKILDFAPGDAK
ncbi:MAG: response regulator [Anaerolineae bacterium]|nr:response regulator [Anaerolineae bacterium]